MLFLQGSSWQRHHCTWASCLLPMFPAPSSWAFSVFTWTGWVRGTDARWHRILLYLGQKPGQVTNSKVRLSQLRQYCHNWGSTVEVAQSQLRQHCHNWGSTVIVTFSQLRLQSSTVTTVVALSHSHNWGSTVTTEVALSQLTTDIMLPCTLSLTLRSITNSMVGLS